MPIGTALLFPSTTSLMSRFSDPRELGTAMGVAQTFAGLARVAAPLLATDDRSSASDTHGRSTWPAVAAFGVVGVLTLPDEAPVRRASPPSWRRRQAASDDEREHRGPAGAAGAAHRRTGNCLVRGLAGSPRQPDPAPAPPSRRFRRRGSRPFPAPIRAPPTPGRSSCPGRFPLRTRRPRLPGPIAAARGAAPSSVSTLPDAAEKWIGQRVFLGIGVLALLVAAGYLLKLSFDRGWIPPIMRCVGGVTLGIAVGAIGWRLHQRYRTMGRR